MRWWCAVLDYWFSFSVVPIAMINRMLDIDFRQNESIHAIVSILVLLV